MDSTLENHIKILNNNIQALIKNHSLLQNENEEMKKIVKQSLDKEKKMNDIVENMQQKLLILQASVGRMDEEEKKQFEKKIDQYVKDIDKCITILSE